MNRILKLLLALSLIFSLAFNAVGCELIKGLDFSEDSGDILGNEDDSDGEQSDDGKTDVEKPDDSGETEDPNDDTDTGNPDGDNTGNNNSGSGNNDTDKPEDSGNNEVVYNDIYVNAYGGFTVPAFTGEEYYIVNNNQPFFTENEIVRESYERYYPLDSLGRATLAMSCIGKDIMPTYNRDFNISYDPSGWIQATYSGTVPGGYLYNRSHLIGWQLTAEESTKENLITGTKFLNQAMMQFENHIADNIKDTDYHVMYRVTPVYTGDNLLADGVLMEAYSVEDNGDMMTMNVFIYNVQPGVIIDYATGSSRLADPEPEEDNDDTTTSYDYVLNTNSKKIHTADCRYVKTMVEANKQEYSGNIQDLLDKGYTKCKTCSPQ